MRGAVDDAAPLDAVRIAFEIELGGMAFYARAARESAEPALRELFGQFAEMENEHMATLSRRYHVEVPAPGDFKIDRAAVYAGIPNHPEDPANLFRIAIAFEQRAVKFFARAGRRDARAAPRSAALQGAGRRGARARRRSSPPSTSASRPASRACCSRGGRTGHRRGGRRHRRRPRAALPAQGGDAPRGGLGAAGREGGAWGGPARRARARAAGGARRRGRGGRDRRGDVPPLPVEERAPALLRREARRRARRSRGRSTSPP